MPLKDPEARKAYDRERGKKRRLENPEKWKDYERLRSQKRYAADPEECRARVEKCRKNHLPERAAAMARWNDNNLDVHLWHVAKGRAKRKELPFSILKEHIVIPEVCPVLGIPLSRGDRKFHDNSPTIDRIEPELGYVPGNIAVISFRANRYKSDATIEELGAVLAFMKEHRLKREKATLSKEDDLIL